MNVSELLERVYQATGFTDRYYVLGLFNDALRTLTDAAKMETSASITTKGGKANLPEDFKAPLALIEGSLSEPDALWEQVQYNDRKEGYLLYGGQLITRPAVSKTFTLLYYRYAPELVGDDDVPGIDPHWHSLLSTYAITMVMALPQVQAEKGLAAMYRVEWESGRRGFTESLSRQTRKARVREVNHW